ncbi:Phytanoyl-CoA dioxygenase family protein [Sulfidibacter corallicola]|uniref:Phytanoyl-CoA dioxygenase family protein n=1 Tax=Sulfidibacter corallicola TaxID=2818388 RepID=A0A8A4TDS2_SULCO|nr:phytanoyl-CoA dioxygenase family protein [Sulfidibacter corallicola]QTD47717.1 phytanoyl-CoA dioxygenase family protein [Sulfidibacter corallicola]
MSPALATLPMLSVDELEIARFDTEGYLVCRGLVPGSSCDRLKAAFEDDIKPFRGVMARDTTREPEAHRFSESGAIVNALLHPHDLTRKAFRPFRDACLHVLSSSALLHWARRLIGADPVLVKSVYHESGTGKAPHADTHFMDSQLTGRMIGCWIALEDIAAQAGRFFVYPGSHRLHDATHFPEDAVEGFLAYESAMLEAIRGYYLEGDTANLRAFELARTRLADVIRGCRLACRTPELKKGDVLFWHARTLHGSLKPKNPPRTRHSLTGHFIPAGSRLLRYHSEVEPVPAREVDGLWVRYRGGRHWS